ncbi:MAG: aminotransferase class IV [Chlorobi bacterium]|nr:aminotransferase class IV [Chlorobiota bacterium]
MYDKADFFICEDKFVRTEEFNIKELEKGFSVYEVVKITDGIPLFLQDHLNRFHQSAALKNVKIPYTDIEIENKIHRLADINDMKNGRLKFAVRFYEGTTKLIMFFLEPINPSIEDYKSGVKIISAKAERKNPNAKIINHDLRNSINKLKKDADVFEVLLVNSEGIITECSKSNIFFVKNGIIYTPFSKDVLSGITRHYIFKTASEKGIDLRERNIRINEVDSFESAFITGTSIGVLPVSVIDDIAYSVPDGTVNILSEAYLKTVESYILSKKMRKPRT